MATRNLTEPFVLMRNNALQSKHIYAEQVHRYNLLVGGMYSTISLELLFTTSLYLSLIELIHPRISRIAWRWLAVTMPRPTMSNSTE